MSLSVVPSIDELAKVAKPRRARKRNADLHVIERPHASAPVELASAPVELASAPVELPSAPVELPSAPVELPSAPVELASARVELPSAPVELASARVELASAPVELAPKRITRTQRAHREAGFLDNIETAFSRRYRLAAVIGVAFGALVPSLAFHAVHYDLDLSQGVTVWGVHVPLSWALLRIAGALVYSGTKVVQCGTQMFKSRWLAAGFALLTELTMLGTRTMAIAIIVLIYLCFVNAVMTTVSLAQHSRAWRES